MSFFDQLIDTPTYQAQALAQSNPAPVQAGLMPMAPAQGYAKGGLSAANENIQHIQIMKVLAHYFKNQGIPVQIGMQGLQKEIEQGLQLIPFESSVMGYKPLDGDKAQIHFFTVGTVKDLADDMKYFVKYLKNKGVHTLYDTLPAPITTNMLVKLGASIEQPDNPKYKLKATL